MLLFMLLIFPTVLIGYCFYSKDIKNFPPVFIGLMSGILLCAFKTLFLYAHRIVPYSVIDNVIYLLVRQTLLPVIVLYGIFIAFSKDDMEFKVKSVFPLLTSFYMVYLPYSIISVSEGLYSGYSIFIKPLLFVFMIYFISYCANKIFNAILDKKILFIIIYSLIAIIYLVVPAVIEGFSIVDEKLFIQILLSVLYCIIPVCVIVLPIVINKLKS